MICSNPLRKESDRMKICIRWMLKAAAAAVMLLFLFQTAAAAGTGDVPFVMPVGDMAPRVPTKPMEMLSSEDAAQINEKMASYSAEAESLLINRAEQYFYYETLEPTTKQIYDLLYQVACDPVNEGNIGLLMTDEDPSSDEFYDKYNLAYRAICFDHPELFWLYSGEEAGICYASEALVMNGLYYVYFLMNEPFTGYTQQMTAFNTAADAFLADIDTGISEYETIRQIHDKLVDMVNYDDAAASAISFGRGQDLAHTAYGSLVADSDGKDHFAVCDGYSLAIEYMCQQCGIEVAFNAGMAGSDPDNAGGHAWNVVKINGEWYELDSTWDDLGSLLDDYPEGSEMYNYCLEMLGDHDYVETYNRRLFLVSTDVISHFVPGDEYVYTTQDQMYELRPAQESVHIRLENDGSDENFDARILQYAPVAEHSFAW